MKRKAPSAIVNRPKLTARTANASIASGNIAPAIASGVVQTSPTTAATGTAVVNANGVVTGITITNAGAGYLSAPTIQIGVNGQPAGARAPGQVLDGIAEGQNQCDPGCQYDAHHRDHHGHKRQ